MLTLPKVMRIDGWVYLVTMILESTGISTFTIAQMPWKWSMHKRSPSSWRLALMYTVSQILTMMWAIQTAMEISRRCRSASTRARSHSRATKTETWIHQCTSRIKLCFHSGTDTMRARRMITSGKYTLTCSIRWCRRASAKNSSTRRSSSAWS